MATMPRSPPSVAHVAQKWNTNHTHKLSDSFYLMYNIIKLNDRMINQLLRLLPLLQPFPPGVDFVL